MTTKIWRRAFAALLILAPVMTAAAQQYRIEYTIAMPEPASHLYSITLFVNGFTGRTVDLQMPVWSPGRYAKMDFAKNVQEFTVIASDGKPIHWDKTNGSHWRITPG